jgi:DNA replication protein DnaC
MLARLRAKSAERSPEPQPGLSVQERQTRAIVRAHIAMGTPPLFRQASPSAEGLKRGLLYVGPTGTGKTWRATADGLRLALDGRSVLWLSLPAYMNAIRLHEPVPTLAAIQRNRVVVLDDIAQTKPPEWMRDTLFSLVDGLLNHRVLVIATSNRDRVDIARTYGDPIASRLTALCPDTRAIEGRDRRLFA